MKIVIFGVGRFYQDKKERIPPDVEILAFLDNNSQLWGGYMDKKPIVPPYKIRQFVYDKIVLMSASAEAMKNQLIELGIEKENIWYWERFSSETSYGTFKFFYGDRETENYKKRILIISTDLDYNGGTLAAVYAAKALQDRNNQVFLAACDGNQVFVDEVVKSGINVVLCPAIPYLHEEELFWIWQFDVVIVNVFQMVLCACEISRIRPVLWWIHEPSDVYQPIKNRFGEYMGEEHWKAIKIYGVSDTARDHFNIYFKDRIEKILPYGIPDQQKKNSPKDKKDCLIFAIIGLVCPKKAQDIFLKAVELLSMEEKENVQFWVIGHIGIDEYGNYIKELAAKDKTIKVKGVLTRAEIHEMYEKIDVVVCPSLEDSLPVVVTEGMMYGKTCIVSDATGSAQYIKDGEDGFICGAGDPMELYERMKWIIDNREKLDGIGEKARQIYKTYFTLEKFGERLEAALQDTIDNWR